MFRVLLQDRLCRSVPFCNSRLPASQTASLRMGPATGSELTLYSSRGVVLIEAWGPYIGFSLTEFVPEQIHGNTRFVAQPVTSASIELLACPGLIIIWIACHVGTELIGLTELVDWVDWLHRRY